MEMLTPDFCFYICSIAVLLYCLVYYYSNKTPQRDHSCVFECLLFCLLFSSFSITAASVLKPFNLPGKNFPHLVQEFFQTSYFAFHSILASLFALYVVLINNSGKMRTLKKIVLFLSPALLVELFILTNPLTGLIFFYQDDILYTRGPLELLIYALEIGYFIFAIREIWIYRFILVKSNMVALSFVIACILGGSFVQLIFPWLQVELFGESLALLGIMLLIEMEGSRTDVITGGYNSHIFIVDNERLIRTQRQYRVMVITLRNYKMLLRMIGHEEMEKATRSIVLWLNKNIQGTVYSIGQDKIGIITMESREACAAFADCFKEIVQSSAFLETSSVPMSTSVDIVSVPDEMQSSELLAELGDDDCNSFQSGFALHHAEDVEKFKRQTEIERILHWAIRQKAFEVYYQPIWNAKTEMFDSAEALLRLSNPNYGSISPTEFIPVAERNGMIHEMGCIVLDQVCRLWRSAQPQKFGLHKIDVNLCISQFYADDMAENFERILEKNEVSAERINLEVQSAFLFREKEKLQRHYERLCRQGFSFSLDDSGVGGVNMVQTLYQDFKTFKLDAAILKKRTRKDMKNFSSEWMQLMRKFQFDVVLKRVESHEQLERALEAGANKIQGFYFSKPLNEEAFLEFIRSQNNMDALQPL